MIDDKENKYQFTDHKEKIKWKSQIILGSGGSDPCQITAHKENITNIMDHMKENSVLCTGHEKQLNHNSQRK